jgi:hypothetical protein
VFGFIIWLTHFPDDVFLNRLAAGANIGNYFVCAFGFDQSGQRPGKFHAKPAMVKKRKGHERVLKKWKLMIPGCISVLINFCEIF